MNRIIGFFFYKQIVVFKNNIVMSGQHLSVLLGWSEDAECTAHFRYDLNDLSNQVNDAEVYTTHHYDQSYHLQNCL